MTGKVVEFGGGHMPPANAVDQALDAARAVLPEHDPFHPVLDGMQALVRTIEGATARIEAGPVERPLTREQLDRVAQAASHGAQHGVDLHGRALDRWTAASVVGAAIAAAALTGLIVHAVDNGRIIDTESALGPMRADDAAALARLVRLNPPASTWTFTNQTTETNGARSGSVALWIDPIKPAAPQTRR